MSTSSAPPAQRRPAVRWRVRALGLVAMAGLMAGGGLGGAEPRAAGRPTTPEAVNQQRVLGSIEDRVRLGLETAGGELANAKIDVRVTPERIVRLSGRVPSPEAKTEAGRLALYAVGVAKVDNQLEVEARPAPPPPPAVAAAPPDVESSGSAQAQPPPSNAALAERVARGIAASLSPPARAQHRWLRGWRVKGQGWSFEVDADAGQVRLDGRIRAPLTIDDVVASARAIPAVRSVEAALEVVE